MMMVIKKDNLHRHRYSLHRNDSSHRRQCSKYWKRLKKARCVCFVHSFVHRPGIFALISVIVCILRESHYKMYLLIQSQFSYHFHPLISYASI